MELDDRMWHCEQDIKNIVDRLGKVEDKSSSAWKTINKVNSDVEGLTQEMNAVKKNVSDLSARFTKMEVDMKEQKIAVNSIQKLLKIIAVLLVFMIIISVVFFVYIWKNDAELAKGILTLGGTVSKTLSPLPI